MWPWGWGGEEPLLVGMAGEPYHPVPGEENPGGGGILPQTVSVVITEATPPSC